MPDRAVDTNSVLCEDCRACGITDEEQLIAANIGMVCEHRRSTVATEGAVCPPHPVDEYGTCTGCGQKIDIAQQLIDAAQQDGLSEFLRATIKSAWCEIKDLRTAVSQIAAIAKEAANA